MQDRDQNKKQKIVDLIQENPPRPPAQPTAQVPEVFHFSNNVISGSVSIHFGASACQIQKESCHE